MKLVIASDIHGAALRCKQLMDAIEEIQPDRVLLLGDLLYHGPRNDLPNDYAPKKVIEMLNSISKEIIAVRGNCEAEVDQMVLDFPCMSDYIILFDASRQLFCTHGHIFASDNLPAGLTENSLFIQGHTHIKFNGFCPKSDTVRLFNPGSVGIPKDGSNSFGIYSDGNFEHVLLPAQ